MTDLNAALSGTFAIGGASDLTASNHFIWLSSNAGGPVASLGLTPVPLPAGLALAGGALLSLAGLRLACRRG